MSNNTPAPAQQSPTDNKTVAASGRLTLFNRLFDKILPDKESDIMDWHQDSEWALLEQEPIRSRALLYCIVATVVTLLAWSAFAQIDEVTRGEGKVIPSQQVQIIQSIDGGMLAEIRVKEGQIVEKDELLFRLDQTRFASSLREKELEYLALQVRAMRLEAIAQGSEFMLTEELQAQIPDVAQQETSLYKRSLEELAIQTSIAEQQLLQRQKEKTEIQAKLEQLKESFGLASRELSMTQPLAQSGAVSEVELIRLEREVANLRGEYNQTSAHLERLSAAVQEAQDKITDVSLSFKNQRREELAQVTAKVNSLRESNLGLSDKVKQTAIRSPVRGTVKRVFFNTVGGVVLQGKEMVEIVPLDDTLLLEARIKPQDIGFLRPQAAAIVKFTAYDFVVYGGLEAKVEHIGADTLTDEDGNPYYNIRVRTTQPNFGADKPILPGMVAEVDILTGKKSILAYLLKPVLRAKQYALSER